MMVRGLPSVTQPVAVLRGSLGRNLNPLPTLPSDHVPPVFGSGALAFDPLGTVFHGVGVRRVILSVPLFQEFGSRYREGGELLGLPPEK